LLQHFPASGNRFAVVKMLASSGSAAMAPAAGTTRRAIF
jgi:hypothetical protein